MAENSIIQTIKSVLAAFIGVQSNQNRQSDFEKGSMTTYIISGLIFTVLFVFAVLFIVSRVLS